MVERGREARLAQETAAELLVLDELRSDQLQGDRAVEREIRCEIDDAHPAASEERLHAVVREAGARAERCWLHGALLRVHGDRTIGRVRSGSGEGRRCGAAPRSVRFASFGRLRRPTRGIHAAVRPPTISARPAAMPHSASIPAAPIPASPQSNPLGPGHLGSRPASGRLAARVTGVGRAQVDRGAGLLASCPAAHGRPASAGRRRKPSAGARVARGVTRVRRAQVDGGRRLLAA